jgi:hypothetical protein
MRVALGIYAAVYIIAITVTIVADVKSKDAPWEMASDAVLLPLSLVGIILHGLGVANPDLKLAWKLLAPLIVRLHADAQDVFRSLHEHMMVLDSPLRVGSRGAYRPTATGLPRESSSASRNSVCVSPAS